VCESRFLKFFYLIISIIDSHGVPNINYCFWKLSKKIGTSLKYYIYSYVETLTNIFFFNSLFLETLKILYYIYLIIFLVNKDILHVQEMFFRTHRSGIELRTKWLRGSSIYHLCADKLANHGHSIVDSVWWDYVPLFVYASFLHDKLGLPYYRFD
jgi:hypothetical protein